MAGDEWIISIRDGLVTRKRIACQIERREHSSSSYERLFDTEDTDDNDWLSCDC